MKTRFLPSIGLATTLAVGMVGAQGLTDKSFALTISFTSGYPTQFLSTTLTDFGDPPPLVPTTPPLSKFNTYLGTLNSVSFELIVRADGTGIATNNNNPLSAPVPITLQFEAAIALVLDVAGIPVTLVANPSDSTVVPDVASGTSTPLIPFLANASQTTGVITDPTILAALSYTGVQTFIPSAASGIGQSLVRGPGNISSIFTTNAGAQVTVTYNFTFTPIPIPAVPEPSSTLGLLVLGGLGLAKSLKRKQN